MTHHPATSSLVDTFVRSLVRSLGWHAGTSLAGALGTWLLVAAVLVLALYVARRARRRLVRSPRSRRPRP